MAFFSVAKVLTTSLEDVFEMPAGLDGAGVFMLSNHSGSARTVAISFYKQQFDSELVLQSALPVEAHSFIKVEVPVSFQAGDKILMSASAGDAVTVQGTVTAAAAVPLAVGPTSRGHYDDEITYAQNDLVRVDEDGCLYLSMQNGNLNNTPSSSPSFWMVYLRDGTNEGIGFTDLGDTPSSYTGNENAMLAVNNGGTAVEFRKLSATSVYANATNAEAAGGAVQAEENDTLLGRVGDALGFFKLVYEMLHADLTASAANMRANADEKLLTVRSVYNAAAPVALTDAATVALNFANFTNATLGIEGNRTFGDPSNEGTVIGKTGWIKVTAVGAERSINRHADMKSTSTITWPIVIPSGQSVYIYYEVEGADNIQIQAVRSNPT